MNRPNSREQEIVDLLMRDGSPNPTDQEACYVRMQRIVELASLGYGAGRLSRLLGLNQKNTSRLLRKARAKIASESAEAGAKYLLKK